jgi:enolase
MPKIDTLTALEILDSRGKPTVQATCRLTNGGVGAVSIPSGRSTGANEAHELRDGDPQRFRGNGVLGAVNNINTIINDALSGKEFAAQADLDKALLDLDGTVNKANLGSNALLGVSFAFARARANADNIPLYRYFAGLIDHDIKTMPRPMINLFSGGKHGGGQIVLQDLLVMPVSAKTTADVLRITYDTYYAAADLCHQRYEMRLLRADEGGLAPPFPDVNAMFDHALEAIEAAGYQPGADVVLALDVAASHFYHDQAFYQIDNADLDASVMIGLLETWADRYFVASIEDGLDENDWQNWPRLMAKLGDRAQIVGDDFLCTNPQRITRAVEANAANTLLLKPNQVGTLTEAAEANQVARGAGWHVIVSARSGETEDNWLADLAVGWGGDQIKIGSITQSERLAKYNRLLAIEAETNLPVIDYAAP